MSRCEDWKIPYLAGIIDGEGCIYVRVGKIGGRRRTRQYQIILVVVTTSLELSVWLKREFGCGNVNSYQPVGNRKLRWQASWSTQGAADVLRKVMPYLLIKKHQAVLALELAEHLRSTKFGGTGICVGEKELAWREAVRMKMKAFNVRGRVVAA